MVKITDNSKRSEGLRFQKLKEYIDERVWWKRGEGRLTTWFHSFPSEDYSEEAYEAFWVVYDIVKADKSVQVKDDPIARDAAKLAMFYAIFTGKLNSEFIKKIYEKGKLLIELDGGWINSEYQDYKPFKYITTDWKNYLLS